MARYPEHEAYTGKIDPGVDRRAGGPGGRKQAGGRQGGGKQGAGYDHVRLQALGARWVHLNSYFQELSQEGPNQSSAGIKHGAAKVAAPRLEDNRGADGCASPRRRSGHWLEAPAPRKSFHGCDRDTAAAGGLAATQRKDGSAPAPFPAGLATQAAMRARAPSPRDVPAPRLRAHQTPQQQGGTDDGRRAASTRTSHAESAPLERGQGPPPPRGLQPIEAGLTTLLVRNVPKSCTLEGLLRAWAPDGSYDLVHYPYNLRGQQRLGYCFMNFVSHELALGFQRRWHACPLPEHCGEPPLDITAARRQGIMETLEYLRGKKLEFMTDTEVLPAIFRGTERLDIRTAVVQLGIISPAPSGRSDGKPPRV